jgi:hypothetical protein
VHVAGEPEPQAIPTGRIDTWLSAWRSALTALIRTRVTDPAHAAGAHRTNRAADRAGHPGDTTPTNGGTHA